MKSIKKALSAILAAAMTAGTLAANAATLPASAATSIDTTSYSQLKFAQEWNNLINMEKQKYPEKVNGKQTYWNHGHVNDYSTTACNHSANSTNFCNFIERPFECYDSADYQIIVETGAHNQNIKYGQCAGFAAKLQSDIFQTNVIVRLKVTSNSYYTALNGKKVRYDFKPGDSVRFDGHSIFITAVNGENLTFAQCNGDSKCGIDWDANSYKGKTITTSYLKQRVEYIDRPMLTGDINLDGQINSEDAALFKSTIMETGSHIDHAGGAPYDVNYDNYIDEKDYNFIKNITSSAVSSTKYVNNKSRSISSRWINYYASDETGALCFKDASGNIYSNKNNTTNGVTFYGNFDKTVKTVTVPSIVSYKGKNYNVTEVGHYENRGPMTGLMERIETLTLPTTVKKIAPYAFYRCALKKITIPNETVLTEIGAYGFYNCDRLDNITLPYNLATVNKYAFSDCDALHTVYFDDDASFNCKLRMIDDGAFTKCPNLWEVTISNNLQQAINLGTRNKSTCSVFDANKNVTLRLPNGNSVAGWLYINNTSDYEKFNNGSLIVYAGNYRFFNPSGQEFKTHPSTGIGRVYPN